MLRIFFGLGLLALVSACATLDEGECLSANWYEIGLQDGSNGKSASHFSRHVKACQKHGVIPQQSPWREGREAGLRLFCVPDRAYQVGRNGNSFPGVCNPAETVEMRVWTFVYFGFFVLLYFLSPGGKTKPTPERLTH